MLQAASGERALSGNMRVREYPNLTAQCIQQLPLSRALAAMAVGLAKYGCGERESESEGRGGGGGGVSMVRGS